MVGKMHQIQLNGRFYRSWVGAVPDVEKELRKALKKQDSFSYHEVAFADYPEGEEASHFDLSTGARVVPLPAPEKTELEILREQEAALLDKLENLDKRSRRPVRALAANPGSKDDKAFLLELEASAQQFRNDLRQVRSQIEAKGGLPSE